MILSGSEISYRINTGEITINPFDQDCINPNSYNVRLGCKILEYIPNITGLADIYDDAQYKTHIMDSNGFVLKKGKLYLAESIERVHTDKYVPMIEGRSSIGRKGIMIHVTAGFGDVGYNGHWTLELISTQEDIRIYPGLEIGQMYFHTIDGMVNYLYSGKYQNNTGVQESMLYKEKDL